MRIEANINRLAEFLLVAEDYKYSYDPDHRNRPEWRSFETEKGWSNDPKDDPKNKSNPINNGTTQVDASYFQAIQSGDMDTAKSIVDNYADSVIRSLPLSENKNSIPNTSSIRASLSDYKSYGVREVPLSWFSSDGVNDYSSVGDRKKVKSLMEAIRYNGGVESPLIVVVDGNKDGMAYVLEGAHRLSAVKELNYQSMPALVIYDNESEAVEFDENQKPIPVGKRFSPVVSGTGNDFNLTMKSKKFTKPPRAKDAKFVWMDTKALEDGFKKNDGYVGVGGSGGLGNRYNMFADFFKNSNSIEVPEIVIKPNGEVEFVNGRHRYSYMRDQGATSIPVALYQGEGVMSLDDAHKHGFLA